MPLLNYTTKVAVDRSVAEIMRTLTKHGATKIMVENDDTGTIKGLSFAVPVDGELAHFKLPADWEPVFHIISKDPKVPYLKRTEEHAKCVAWRIMKDWVEAQMAILETKMVKLDQIFLPYAIVGKDKTLYEHVTEQKLLSSGA